MFFKCSKNPSTNEEQMALAKNIMKNVLKERTIVMFFTFWLCFNLSYCLLVLYDANFGYTIANGEMIAIDEKLVRTHHVIKNRLRALEFNTNAEPELDSFNVIQKLNITAIYQWKRMEQTSSVRSRTSFILNLNSLIENYMSTEEASAIFQNFRNVEKEEDSKDSKKWGMT